MVISFLFIIFFSGLIESKRRNILLTILFFLDPQPQSGIMLLMISVTLMNSLNLLWVGVVQFIN